MPFSPRLKLFPYLAVAAVLLIVGIYSLRGGGGSGESRVLEGGVAQADASVTETGLSIGSAGRKLVVDVAGAVRRPGVYRLASGSRVIDAIRKAGGPSGNALPGAINRAAKLADGQQVVVPVAAVPGSGPATSTAAAPIGSDAPISLGSATAEQLEQIDGIGPVTANNIIEYRDSMGGLASVDQIDEVSGIGPVTMEALRSSLQP